MLFQHYVGKTTYTIKPVQITLLPHHDISRHIVYIYIYSIYIFMYLLFFIYILSGILSGIYSGILKRKWTGRGQVRVRQGPLRSRACSWGPAGATLILGLLFESGRTTAISHLQLIEVRQGPCSLIRGLLFGPAGTTAITSLQLRSGGEHSDPGLVVWSSACSWGQAEKGEGEGGGQLT